jgi:CheY-like chemotaxis protein
MSEEQAERNEIHVAVRADGDLALLEVTDNGGGIPPEVLPRIFDPFFTTKPVGVGTGLGLSICHGIITSLGGRITVRSQLGEGTSFRISLPTMDDAELEAAAAATGVEAPPSRQGPRARVLVVDDEVPIANTLRDLLETEHDVVATTSAREALAAVRANGAFDVVFCDLMMPGMSGIELYERLHQERPGLERRVVFMTGGAFTARAAEFLASIDNQRIEKPFDIAAVERIVRQMAGAGRTP